MRSRAAVRRRWLIGSRASWSKSGSGQRAAGSGTWELTGCGRAWVMPVTFHRTSAATVAAGGGSVVVVEKRSTIGGLKVIRHLSCMSGRRQGGIRSTDSVLTLKGRTDSWGRGLVWWRWWWWWWSATLGQISEGVVPVGQGRLSTGPPRVMHQSASACGDGEISSSCRLVTTLEVFLM